MHKKLLAIVMITALIGLTALPFAFSRDQDSVIAGDVFSPRHRPAAPFRS